MGKRYTKEEISLIQRYIRQGLTNVEIQKKIKHRSIHSVSLFIGRKLGGNKNYIKKGKHRNNYLALKKYFYNHTAEETRKHFGYTKSEFKSCLTYSYKLFPDFYEKCPEKKLNWNDWQLQTMLKLCGIISRDEIAKIIKKPQERTIKEKLMNLGVASRNINGITFDGYLNLFGVQPRYYIKTLAGPRSKTTDFCFIIVPWSVIEKDILKNQIYCSEINAKAVSIMSNFQKWLWRSETPHIKIKRFLTSFRKNIK